MTYADHLKQGGEGRVLTEAMVPGAVREEHESREPWPSWSMPMRVYDATVERGELLIIRERPVVGMPHTLSREMGGCGVPGCRCCEPYE